MAQGGGYFPGTRHPWPCLLFLLPLLLAYEGGVVWLGGAQPEALRNGADHWLRCGLRAAHLPSWLPPCLLVLVFLVWDWSRREERPADLVGVLSGIVLESVAFALGLWCLSRLLSPLLDQLGVPLSLAVEEADPTLGQLVHRLGAGIYEEALFRLALFSVLVRLLRGVEVLPGLAVTLAALGSATLFSAAHHIVPNGEAYGNFLFLFRLLAGVYFALLFQLRGFGVAVGAHACYNVMVSVGAG
jgi:hypothetical protein